MTTSTIERLRGPSQADELEALCATLSEVHLQVDSALAVFEYLAEQLAWQPGAESRMYWAGIFALRQGAAELQKAYEGK